MTAPTIDQPAVDAVAVQVHTGGMVALIPSPEYAVKLAVAGGLPAGELHLTLCYLGDDVTAWPPEVIDATVQVAMGLADPGAAMSDDTESDAADTGGSQGEAEEVPAGLGGPLTLNVFAWSQFNPTGGPDGQEPCMVYQFSGDGDYLKVLDLAGLVQSRMDDAIGDAFYPDQYSPFVPHTTAGYGLPSNALTYTGPVVFDRLRVALGDNVIDLPLGGGGSMVGAAPAAAIVDLPPIGWFRDPQLTEPTALTVGDDGRVAGHLALWRTPHIGFPGRSITPPRSKSDYAYFHTGARNVADGAQAATIATGHVTLNTGHADIGDDYRAASAHYDNTGTLVADVCAGEDKHGIWISGALSPGIDDLKLHKLRACGLSGDWRRIGPGLELVAALSVPTPGFPIPRSRVASGEPFALVAAGAVPQVDLSAPLDYDALADVIVDRMEHRQAVTAALISKKTALLAELDDSPARMAALLASFGDADPSVAEWLAEFGGSDGAVTAAATAKRGNWVTKTGTGHLPSYIKRIVDHLKAKGMTEGHAIAVAKNAAQRMCDSGDLNFKGLQQVNPGSRAEACAAISEWNAKRAESHAN